MGCVFGLCTAGQCLPAIGKSRKRLKGPKHRRYALTEHTNDGGSADLALEGELSDLIDEFSDGRIQFAFVKIKDPNTTLPKSILVAWCGEGVPERTKGYFTSHTSAVSKVLHVRLYAEKQRKHADANRDITCR